MDLFHYHTFLKTCLFNIEAYIFKDSLRWKFCDHTSFEVFLIFRVMQIKMKGTYSRAEKRQQNQWKMKIFEVLKTISLLNFLI